MCGVSVDGVGCAQFISTELMLLVVLAFNGGLTRKGTPSGRPLRVEAIMPAHKVILLMHTQTLTHVQIHTQEQISFTIHTTSAQTSLPATHGILKLMWAGIGVRFGTETGTQGTGTQGYLTLWPLVWR